MDKPLGNAHIRMRNAESLTDSQINEFLKASEESNSAGKIARRFIPGSKKCWSNRNISSIAAFDLREKPISRLAIFEDFVPERFLLFAGRRSKTMPSAWRSASTNGRCIQREMERPAKARFQTARSP